MARKRDYRAEYQRRIARAKEFGYSKSVARGHPRKGIAGIKLAKVLKIEPGQEIASRPAFKRPTETGSTFEQQLIGAGFKHFLTEERKRVIVRELNDPTIPAKELEVIATTQIEFLNRMMDVNHSEREAFTLWFSPK